MSCVMSPPNLKIFGKGIHALSRIADYLFIEALSSGLVCRTVNSSRSAYVCFTLKPDFFITYKQDSNTDCKVLLKSFLLAFHSLPSVEKNVEKCFLDLTRSSDYLYLEFICKQGLKKTYELPLIDEETCQSRVPIVSFLCTLTASSRLLYDGIQNFSNSVDEVTLTVCSDKVVLKNYAEDEPDPSKVVHTELALESDEFDDFVVTEETEVTFCLKEFKAILNFSEACGVPVKIKCCTAGKPIIFTVDDIQGANIDFVLGTLSDKESQVTSSHRDFIQTSVGNTASTNQASLITSLNCNSNRNNVNQASTSSCVPHRLKGSKKRAVAKKKSVNGKTVSKVIQERSPLADQCEISQELLFEPCEDDNMDEIPSTPPSKKFRSEFLGLSQSTCTSMFPDSDEVLVPDSEED